MGILERTRAILVSTLGVRVKDASADERALKDLILVLEKAKVDVTAGLETLARELEYLENHERGAGREVAIEKAAADIAEGEIELKRVEQGIKDAQAALSALKNTNAS